MQRQPRLHASAPGQSSCNFSSETCLASPCPAKTRASRLTLQTHLRARKSGQEAAVTNSPEPQRSYARPSTWRAERTSTRTNVFPCFEPPEHVVKALSAYRHGCLPSASRSPLSTSAAARARPNPSLSPRPTTAGRLARAARWFMLHRTGKPSRLRGRG
jgi:hypothetical protein